MKEKGYIVGFREDLIDKKKIVVKVSKNVSKIQIISPRYPIKNKDMREFEKKILPRPAIGDVLITSNKGIKRNNGVFILSSLNNFVRDCEQ